MDDFNPWTAIPLSSPYVLEGDKAAIDDFNMKVRDDYKVQLDILPEPFVGDPKAPIVLLGLNPGFNAVEDHLVHANPAFVECLRANLAHGPSAYPLYALNPEVTRAGESGRKWWGRTLGAWIKAVGPQTVSRGVLCVEHFPYHSRRFHHGVPTLESQKYSFSLVRRAIDRSATVIMLRGKRFWLGPNAVPELAQCPQLCRTNSVQNPTISERNCPDGFQRGLAALKSVANCA